MCELLVGLPDVNVIGVGDWPLYLRIAITTRESVLDGQRWVTRNDLRYAIIHWIEHTHNRRRCRQRRLGRLTPVELELAFTTEAARQQHNNHQPKSQQTRRRRPAFPFGSLTTALLAWTACKDG